LPHAAQKDVINLLSATKERKHNFSGVRQKNIIKVLAMDIKLQTIKGKKAFSFIFENGKKFFDTNSMAVFYFVKSENDNAEFNNSLIVNYSVSVPKKFAKKAVVRNRIKRLMRESVRHFFMNYPNSVFLLSEMAVAFIWRNAPRHPMLIGLSDVLPEIEKHMQRGIDFFKKENSDSQNEKLKI